MNRYSTNWKKKYPWRRIVKLSRGNRLVQRFNGVYNPRRKFWFREVNMATGYVTYYRTYSDMMNRRKGRKIKAL